MTNDWHLIEFDPAKRKKIWIKLGEGDQILVREEIEVDESVALAAQLRAENSGSRQPEISMQAIIPENIFHEQLAEAYKQQDRGYIRKWLNDGDHGRFRVRDGKS